MPNIREQFIPQKEFTNGGWTGPICPLALLGCKELSLAEKAVWLTLSNHAGYNGKCYPSQAKLAEETALSPRGVKNALKGLKEKGFITWDTGGPGKCNRYYFLWHDAFEKGKYKVDLRDRALRAVVSDA